MNENLIDRIVDAINTDCVSSDKKEADIMNFYSRLDDEEKKVVDRLMIKMTGWTLKTLMYGEEDDE